LSCVPVTTYVENCRAYKRILSSFEVCNACENGFYLKESDHECYSNEEVGKEGCMVVNDNNFCDYCNHFNDYYAVDFDQTHGSVCVKYGFNINAGRMIVVFIVALFALEF